jgi:hypothetical protein
MATIAEVEKLALDLPETERAALAAHLLGSLPSVLHDEDEGIAEALRRDAEFEANPSRVWPLFSSGTGAPVPSSLTDPVLAEIEQGFQGACGRRAD